MSTCLGKVGRPVIALIGAKSGLVALLSGWIASRVVTRMTLNLTEKAQRVLTAGLGARVVGLGVVGVSARTV